MDKISGWGKRAKRLKRIDGADEPTGNLDSKNGLEVMQLLTQLNQEGTTVVMVTHSERDAGYAQRIINLLDGQVVPEVSL